MVVTVKGQPDLTCSCASLRSCMSKNLNLLNLLNGNQLTLNETVYSYLPFSSNNSVDTRNDLILYLSTFTGFNTSLNAYLDVIKPVVQPTPNMTSYQSSLRVLISEIATDFQVTSKGDIIVGDGSLKTVVEIYGENYLVADRLKTFLRNRYLACPCSTGRKRREGRDRPKLIIDKKESKKSKKSIVQKKERKSKKGKNKGSRSKLSN
ncbi:hypothetical protein BgiBS90_005889 [Biomphalaria glabrata]|nr:hypothetical protein BgiBS90_005889 [Biomphalaria glabrata]